MQEYRGFPREPEYIITVSLNDTDNSPWSLLQSTRQMSSDTNNPESALKATKKQGQTQSSSRESVAPITNIYTRNKTSVKTGEYHEKYFHFLMIQRSIAQKTKQSSHGSAPTCHGTQNNERLLYSCYCNREPKNMISMGDYLQSHGPLGQPQ